MKMNKTVAAVLAVILTVVILGTFASILAGWFNPVVKVAGLLIGYLMLFDMNVIFHLMAGSYDPER